MPVYAAAAAAAAPLVAEDVGEDPAAEDDRFGN